jgi:muramidase (phage lysozyme)
VTPSLPKTQDSVKVKEINDIILTKAESQDAFADFQTTHFTKCYQQWHDFWANLIKSQEEYSGEDKHSLGGNYCCCGEINSVYTV